MVAPRPQPVREPSPIRLVSVPSPEELGIRLGEIDKPLVIPSPQELGIDLEKP
jgi:hypothetical protein